VTIPTLVDVLQSRAAERGTKVAFADLAGDDTIDHTVTFAHLDAIARATATGIQERAPAGERVLLLFPPGIEFIGAFMGCLYAGAVAVPSYPPLPSRLDRGAAARLATIVDDSEPALILTTTSLEERTRTLFDTQAPPILVPDMLDISRADDWSRPGIDADSTAFLQYTSGTTGPPKGVVISHANVLHNLELINSVLQITDDDIGVNWLPPYHDMGLIGGVLQPIVRGTSVTMMSPVSFLQRPIRWLETISRTRATITGGPNFAYDHCVQRITEEQKAGLDLSCWRAAMNGAEPINVSTLNAFTSAFGECGFSPNAWSPCYGMAEATVFVCGGPRKGKPLSHTFGGIVLDHGYAVEDSDAVSHKRTLVSSGSVDTSLRVEIVHPDAGTICQTGEIGEIWVSGGSIGKGYWNNEELTDRDLRAKIDGAGSFFRTGDAGFIHDGDLYVVGRLKDKLELEDGRILYPQDVEASVEASDPVLRRNGVAVIAVDGNVIVLAEVERQAIGKVDTAVVIDTIRHSVRIEHDLDITDVTLLKPGAIPRTSSGKMQRYLCRELYRFSTFEPIGSSKS